MNSNIDNLIETGKLVTEVAMHARDNQSFKEKLMGAPRATIDSYAGKEVIPSNKKIVVTEPNSEEVYFVIPQKVDVEDLELTDVELESLSGGSDIVTGIVIGVAAIGVGWVASKIF